MASAAAAAVTVQDLREDFALGCGALQAGQKRVDRARKIIYGVKMLAASSRNAHGLDDVDGTDYAYAAVQRAAPLYEGLKANVDHPPREKPKQSRSSYDRIGKYFNVRAEHASNPELGELFGDLHLLPSHRLTESLLDAAENEQLNDVYALSHNASGSGEVRNRRFLVTNIPEARSVDVVADGGGTLSIFESLEPPATKEKPMSTPKLGKVILESKLPLAIKAILLEDAGLMDADVAAAPEGAGDDAWKDHLVSAVAALVKSDAPEAHDRAKKILKMLAPDCKLEESATTVPVPPPIAGETEEARKAREDADKLRTKQLLDSREESKLLLTTVGLKAEGPLLEALAGVGDLKGKLAIVNELKALAGGNPAKPAQKAPPGAPRTPATATTTTLEGAAAPKCDDLLGVQLR